MKNELGNTYGKLTVIEYKGIDSSKQATWLCKCECGEERIIRGYCLRAKLSTHCGCSRSTVNDLTGQIFDRLTVLSRIKRPGLPTWLCVCDCEKQVYVRAKDLTRGHTKSCGCLKREWASALGTQGHLHRKYSPEEATWKRLYKAHNTNYKKFGALPFEEWKALSQQECFYCGAPPKNRWGDITYGVPVKVNGIDRIDSNLGYTINNTVASCQQCNIAKRDNTQEEFYRMCLAVTLKHQLHKEI